jgi:hypothetical protein
VRRRLTGVVLLGAAVAVALAGGCSSDDDSPEDPADALAERVSAILDDDSSAVLERLAEGDVGVTADELADADVLCPRVTDPEPGDRATCRVTAGVTELELDIEFGGDGGLDVVAVAVAP